MLCFIQLAFQYPRGGGGELHLELKLRIAHGFSFKDTLLCVWDFSQNIAYTMRQKLLGGSNV